MGWRWMAKRMVPRKAGAAAATTACVRGHRGRLDWQVVWQQVCVYVSVCVCRWQMGHWEPSSVDTYLKVRHRKLSK